MDNQNHHIAILAFPFGTHAAPLLHLTRMLAAAAPNVTFSFFNIPKSNRSMFDSQAADGNLKAYDVDDGVPDGYAFTGRPQEGIELFVNVTPDNFKKAMDKAVSETGKKITCLLTDAFIWQAADMAEEMNACWVPLWTAGACSLSTHFYTDLIRNAAAAAPPDHSGKKELPLNSVPGIPSGIASNISINDVPLEVLGGNLDSIFSRLLHRMGHTISRGTAITINSFEELDPPIIDDFKAKFRTCLAVGPFNLTSSSSQLSNLDPNGCLTWLNSHKPASVAYVSFGTVLTPPTNELIALAEALEQSGVPFLWSLKENGKVQLPQGFLDRTRERGMIVSWAPQSQVLEHASVGVFVTHCGWNSVMESITGGVPMICRPFFGDQRLNRRLVSDVWEIGVGAKDGVLSKDGLMEALDLVLLKDEGKKMREKVGAIKDLAIQAVGPQGSSTKNFNTLLDIITTTNS